MATRTPAYCRRQAYRKFAEALPSSGTPEGLFRAGWAIALHESPDADLTAGESAIDGLARAVRRRVRSKSSEAILAHLHDVLFDVAGFSGNVTDYYAAGNSYLPEVLQSRQGLPITLALIYRTVGSKAGLTIHGVNAPGHFLAEVETPEGHGPPSIFVDPFNAGRMLTEDEALDRIADATRHEIEPDSSMLMRATPQQWLRRMLHNLQAVFTATSRDRDSYAMQELEQLLSE